MKTLFLTLRAMVFASCFLSAWAWVALRARAFDPSISNPLPAWTLPLGLGLSVPAWILVLTCIGLFILRGQGTPAVFDPPREFVAVGPYRYVRNPMYIGGITLLVSLGLYARSYAILLLAAASFVVLYLFVVAVEEPQLRQRFGKTYDDYLHTVPRWLPGMRAGIHPFGPKMYG